MCVRSGRQRFLLCVGGLGPFAAPRAYYLLLWVAVRGPTPRIAGSLLCRPLTSLGVRFLVFVSGVWGFGLFPASAEFFPVLAPGRFVALGHRILFPCKPMGCRCGGMGFPRVHNNPEQGLGVLFFVSVRPVVCAPPVVVPSLPLLAMAHPRCFAFVFSLILAFRPSSLQDGHWQVPLPESMHR